MNGRLDLVAPPLERYVDARELASLMGVSTTDDRPDGHGGDAVRDLGHESHP